MELLELLELLELVRIVRIIRIVRIVRISRFGRIFRVGRIGRIVCMLGLKMSCRKVNGSGASLSCTDFISKFRLSISFSHFPG